MRLNALDTLRYLLWEHSYSLLYCVKFLSQSPTWWWVTAPTQYLRVENCWPQHRAKAVLFLESESILVISKLDNAAESVLSLESCPPASCTIMKNPTQQFGMNESFIVSGIAMAGEHWLNHTFNIPPSSTSSANSNDAPYLEFIGPELFRIDSIRFIHPL